MEGTAGLEDTVAAELLLPSPASQRLGFVGARSPKKPTASLQVGASLFVHEGVSKLYTENPDS